MTSKYKTSLLLLLILPPLLALCPQAGFTESEAPPETPYPIIYRNLAHGETLTYEAGWNGIPAATATAVTTRVPDDQNLIKVSFEARTRGYVSWIYRLIYHGEAVFNDREFRPVNFFIKYDENRKVETRDLIFDYRDNLIKVTRQKKQTVKKHQVPMGVTYDPVTAAFLLRAIELNAGEAYQVEVCEGRKVYLVRMDIIGKEDIKIKLGTFTAYRMNGSFKELHADDIKPPKRKKFHWATLWISADDVRIPLKIESKVFWGYVYLELTSENRGLIRQ